VIAGKANTWLRLNQPEKALKLLEPIVQKGNEDATISIAYAKALLENKMPDEAAQALLPHLPAKSESIETRRTLYFLVGKAMEEAGEYANAFEAYTEGNALSESSFDLDALVNRHNQIIDSYPADCAESMQTSSKDDTSLVFIVGMLRSGSTLTEQILDAHPKGEGLGELETLSLLLHDKEWSTVTNEDLRTIANEYLVQIGKISNAPLRIDKQLGNYQHVGCIKQLFPNAKIIHCTRNPISMGLSCYSQKLPPFTNGWASSLHSIGHFYNEYMRLMQHWDKVFGNSILTVSYEELVADQEGTTKRILEFCDLEYDPRCLEFWKTGRAVLTLSQDQVRKPMYDSSVARHERFGALLDPLRDALGV